MTHANTSAEFRLTLKRYPCVFPSSCPVIGGNPCPHDSDLSRCSIGRYLKKSTTLICDSGVFQKQGCGFTSYKELFRIYEALGAEYGVIMDSPKEKDVTLETAQEAMDEYRASGWNFNIIGVAQGRTLDDYIQCYAKLKSMGYDHIAVGGMLHRKIKSARYVMVSDEKLMRATLASIRKTDPDGWLFALGCYSPQRHHIFLENNVFGSDSKGWMFQYTGVSPKRGNKRSRESRFTQVRGFVMDEILARPQAWRKKTRLLIIPCSKKKKVFRGPAQAIKVYDGPLFRLLRKHVNDFSNDNGFDVLILSAKYGLIEPTKTITNYDQQMTNERAEDLVPQVNAEFEKVMSRKIYTDVLVNLGATYLQALKPSLSRSSFEASIQLVDGRIGERLASTKRWIVSETL